MRVSREAEDRGVRIREQLKKKEKKTKTKAHGGFQVFRVSSLDKG